MKAYSVDLRQRIVEAYEQNEGSQRELAQRFKVSLTFVQSLLKRFHAEETIEPKPHTGGFLPKLANHLNLIKQLVEQDNDATLEELCSQLEQKTGLRVSISTMCRALQLLNLTRKKKHFMPLKQKRIEFKGCVAIIGKRFETCAQKT
jgi:transposase